MLVPCFSGCPCCFWLFDPAMNHRGVSLEWGDSAEIPRKLITTIAHNVTVSTIFSVMDHHILSSIRNSTPICSLISMWDHLDMIWDLWIHFQFPCFLGNQIVFAPVLCLHVLVRWVCQNFSMQLMWVWIRQLFRVIHVAWAISLHISAVMERGAMIVTKYHSFGWWFRNPANQLRAR